MMLNDRKYKQIVNEWFAQLEKGFAKPPYSKHELEVLNEVMQKYNLHDTQVLNEAAANFGIELEKYFLAKGYPKVPAVAGNYSVKPGPLQLDPNDEKPFTDLFDFTTSKDVGNGEIALYWLFNYKDPNNPSNTARESHGKSAADLEINGIPCEVKAYQAHNMKIKLGVFESSHEIRQRLNSIFGVVNLTSAITGTKNYYSELAFKVDDLAKAFDSVLQAKKIFANDEIRQVLNVNSASSIFNKFVSELDKISSGNAADPNTLARDFMADFIAFRIELKFAGREGYLINCLKGAPTNIYMFKIPSNPAEFLKNVDFASFNKMVSVETANLKMNYNIFNT